VDVEPYIKKYGEKHRRLIVGALEFHASRPYAATIEDFDLDAYIEDVVSRVSPEDP